MAAPDFVFSGDVTGSGNLSPEAKAELTIRVENLIAAWQEGAPHSEIQGRADRLRQDLMSSGGWSDRGWGIFGPSFKPAGFLLSETNRIHGESLVVAKGLDPKLLPRNQPSPLKEGYEEFKRQVTPPKDTDPKSEILKILALLGGVYLLGKYMEGRGRG